MSKNTNKLTIVSAYEALVASLATLSDADPLILGGKKTPKADVLVALKVVLTAADGEQSAHTQWKNALVGLRSALATTAPLRKLLKAYLVSRFGESSPDLVQFGFKPRKATKSSVKAQFEGVQKREATRKARHTMGTHQRLSVHGELGVEPAPANGAPAPAAPPTPPKA